MSWLLKLKDPVLHFFFMHSALTDVQTNLHLICKQMSIFLVAEESWIYFAWVNSLICA